MRASPVRRWFAAPVLGFVLVAPRRSLPEDADPLQRVANALMPSSSPVECIILPDTLKLDRAGAPPFQYCSASGAYVLRESGGRIVEFGLRYRDGTSNYAARTADSVSNLLRPIIGAPRHWREPGFIEWNAPDYHASIVIEPNSDVVRPDRAWRAVFAMDRGRGTAPCGAP
jgi:hypothetical protein